MVLRKTDLIACTGYVPRNILRLLLSRAEVPLSVYLYINSQSNDSILLGQNQNTSVCDYEMMLNSGNWSLTLISRRISLLIWKNFLFQKRHYIVTALEIVLPTLFAIFLALVKSRKGDYDSWEKVFPEIFEEWDEVVSQYTNMVL